MNRFAAFAALGALALTGLAHASVTVRTQDTTTWVAPSAELMGPSLQFNAPPMPLVADGVSLPGGEKAITSIVGDTSSGSVNLTNLNTDLNTGSLFGQLAGGGTVTLNSGGTTTQANGGITDLVKQLIGTGGGSGSVTTITPPTAGPIIITQPLEPLPLEGVIPPGELLYPPFLPPVYPQQASMACSGAFSVTFGAKITVNCQADLSFSNGMLLDGHAIQANAVGNILLDNVRFTAPTIEFNAGGQFLVSDKPLWLDGDTTINAVGVNVASTLGLSGTGSLTINSQTITFNTAIPEPGTWALMGLGLVGLSLVARRRHG